jgi:hypothetical protein
MATILNPQEFILRRFFMKIIVFAVTALLAWSALGSAQPLSAAPAGNPHESAALLQKKAAAEQAITQSSLATGACLYSFSTGGAGDAVLNYCVTINGNITSIETPSLHQNVAVEQAEGYGLCDQSTGIIYNDFAGMGDAGTGNWGPPTLASRTATAVKIVRTTTDGAWTLTQVITKVGGDSPNIRIAMTLKNNSAVDKFANLIRYLDTDIDGVAGNSFDATTESSAAWNSTTVSSTFDQATGLVLENIGTPGGLHTAFTQRVYWPPSPCDPFANYGHLFIGDGSLGLFYRPFVSAHSSATLTMMYRGW